MMFVRSLLGFVSALCLGQVEVQASDLQARGVNIVYSCEKRTGNVELLNLLYINPNLPESAKVQIHWGLGGYVSTSSIIHDMQESPLLWENGSGRGEDDVSRQTDPFLVQEKPGHFAISLQISTYVPGEKWYFDKIQFVFKVSSLTGEFWDKPGPTDGLGYYETSFLNNGNCVDGQHPPDPLAPLIIKKIF